MKKLIIILSVLCLFLSGCDGYEQPEELSVVATVFPAYDFARAVCEDENLHMLLPPGTEIHSFEPSPEDILKIQAADVFIYNGGDSDTWVQKVLNSIDIRDKTIIKMTDHSSLIYNCDDEHDHHHSPDEHVWMSPDNAKSIVLAIARALADKRPASAEKYLENARNYCAEIEKISADTKRIIEDADTRKIVVADRFPLKYFCEYFSLEYDAAFDACDLLADADAKTVLRLIDTVRNDDLKYVYYIESGSGYLADTVCEETGAEKLMLNSLHTISSADFENGMTYLDALEHNKKMLERGLAIADN